MKTKEFERAAAAQGRTLDAGQLAAAGALAAVLPRYGARRRARTGAGRGLYLWGAPGRGKSWLVDTGIALAGGSGVLRTHFHSFFRDLHRDVFAAQQQPANGRSENPVEAALTHLLGPARILVLDEFHVHDPGDGAYLGRLVRHLDAHGILLIASSNYAPRKLMPNPLFHEQFVPTVALLEHRLSVVHIGRGPDYRSAAAGTFGAWLRGPDDYARHGLEVPAAAERVSLRPGSVDVAARRATDAELWVGFRQLCGARTNAADILALAAPRERVVLADVPPPAQWLPDEAQRFAHLVDIAYDAGTRLFVETDDWDPGDLRDAPVRDLDRLASRLSQLA